MPRGASVTCTGVGMQGYSGPTDAALYQHSPNVNHANRPTVSACATMQCSFVLAAPLPVSMRAHTHTQTQ